MELSLLYMKFVAISILGLFVKKADFFASEKQIGTIKRAHPRSLISERYSRHGNVLHAKFRPIL